MNRNDHLAHVDTPVTKVGRKKVARVSGDVAGVPYQVKGAHLRTAPRPDQKRQRGGPTNVVQPAVTLSRCSGMQALQRRC